MVVHSLKKFSVELKVKDSDGDWLTEISHGRETYVVAKPGDTFQVCVRNRGGGVLSAELEVGGKNVGYQTYMYGDSWTSFDGFTDGPSSYRTFVFAPTEAVEDAAKPTNARTRVGQLRLRVFVNEEYLCPGVRRCKDCRMRGHTEEPDPEDTTNEGVQKVTYADEKKFYAAPSLAVAAGSVVSFRRGSRSKKHRKCIGKPILSANLRCETAETLLLRHIIHPSDPQHAALLPPAVLAAINTPVHSPSGMPLKQPCTPQAEKVRNRKALSNKDLLTTKVKDEAGRDGDGEDRGDDDTTMIVVEKPAVPVVDLDDQPDSEEDCVILYEHRPTKRSRPT